MEQTHRNNPQHTDEVEEVEAKDLRDQDLADTIDDLLDAIDDVLEENAQEFVESFVQKGGE